MGNENLLDSDEREILLQASVICYKIGAFELTDQLADIVEFYRKSESTE